MTKLGIIVRADLGSGLQSQSYNLTRMLKPDRVLIVDSTPFNGAQQYPEMYEGFESFTSNGFPTNLDSARFMNGLTHVLAAETIYNNKMYEIGRMKQIKTFTQTNWEFNDHIKNPRLPKPTTWLMPSYWHLEEMKSIHSNTVYLPPPIFMNDFKEARNANLSRDSKRRFVHIIGKAASHDRNGTFDVIDALKHTDVDFELVVRSQYEIPEYQELMNDNRIKLEIGNKEDQQELYKDFDAMILPRRYGGLCLPVNEALSCGLPVIMTDVSPNNQILPKEWLVPAQVFNQFMARTNIDIYKSDTMRLGKKLEAFATMDSKKLLEYKTRAVDLAMDNYSHEILKPQYQEIMEL